MNPATAAEKTTDAVSVGSTSDSRRGLETIAMLFPDAVVQGKIDLDRLRRLLGPELLHDPTDNDAATDIDDGATENGDGATENDDGATEHDGGATEHDQGRFELLWSGKSRARRLASIPPTASLVPCPDRSVRWETTGNLLIEGDNLEVLKLLGKSYHGKVKLIYVDPPYNTGKEFVYRDRFQEDRGAYLKRTGQQADDGPRVGTNCETAGRYHTNWLNMMYPRLMLARNLLTDDGLIFISIDDHEAANLRKLCDEIFGEENFLSQIVWKKSYGGGAKARHVVGLHEYVICFARDKQRVGSIELPPNPEHGKYYRHRDSKFDARGPYRTQPLWTNSMDTRRNLRFGIPYQGREIWPDKQWQWSRERVLQALENDELVFVDGDDRCCVYYKQYLRDESGRERGAKPYSILDGPYTRQGTAEIEEIFGDGKVFSFPKPTGLIEHLLSYVIDDERAIVLDFFAGSGTTAHAVLNVNRRFGGGRRFICVQLPEACGGSSTAARLGLTTIADVARERIRRVLESMPPDSSGDLGFRLFRLDRDLHRREPGAEASSSDRPAPPDDPDVLDVLYRLLPAAGIDLSASIESVEISGRRVHLVDEGGLVVCLSDGIDSAVAGGIASLTASGRCRATRVVLRDDGFVDDRAKMNSLSLLRRAGISDVRCI